MSSSDVKDPTAIPSVATTTPFTEEGTIDDACSMKTISISVSLARKSDEEMTVRMLSKKIERGTHDNTDSSLKNETSVNRSN